MSERCPRCSTPVYFAEEQRALGKKWHKRCFKCANCNKMLDSTTYAEHEMEAFCKSCYGKLFGPKGYGYSGGAAGLSANSTTNRYTPNRERKGSVHHFGKAQSAPLLRANSFEWGRSDACLRCGRTVYYAEEVRAMGRKWHKICLKCGHCGKQLDSMNCTDHGGEVFCRTCYGRLFGPKGYGFAEGAAMLSMETGNPYEICVNNVSHFAQAQAAPLMNETNRIGRGDRCPSCNMAVYSAEEIRALGKKYHKLCLKCGNCNKLLDSTTVTDHEDQVFCKACYGKLFGPKGYGFAGGASGLSMDTGVPGQITTENRSHIAEAQAAPLICSYQGDNMQDICNRCGKRVYFAEQAIGGGNIYHKVCFRCTTCGKNLDSSILAENDSNIYCRSCYGKNFGPKGFGFGNANMTTS